MSQAEELLMAISETTITGEYVVVGSDRHIIVPDNLKKLGVQYDHDVNTVTFKGPRYSDGRDMFTMNIYVNYMRTDGYMDAYPCTNVEVCDDDETFMTYDWVITRNVTEIHGALTALVCAKRVDADGNEQNHWNSEVCTDFYVSAGMEVEGTILAQHSDIIEYLLLRLDTAEAPIKETVHEYLDEYVDICTTTDSTLANSHAGGLEVVSIEGVSEQTENPSLDNPFDILNAGPEITVKTHGKNFINTIATTTTKNGLTFTVNEDKSVTVNGTSTALTTFVLTETGGRAINKPGEYILSGTINESKYVDIIVDGKQILDKGNSKTFEIDDTSVNYARVVIGNGVTCTNDTLYPMIRKADVEDATYEPYQESTVHITLPEELRRVGDFVDRIINKDGVWGIEKNVYEKSFDGTEIISNSFTGVGGTGLYVGVNDDNVAFNKDSDTLSGSLCNYLTEQSGDDIWKGSLNAFAIAFATHCEFRMRFLELSTVDEVKAWLTEKYTAGKPLTIVTGLRTPTFTPLDEATQEALDSLKVYDGVTYLVVDSTVQPVTTVKYGTSEVGARTLKNSNDISKINRALESLKS